MVEFDEVVAQREPSNCTKGTDSSGEGSGGRGEGGKGERASEVQQLSGAGDGAQGKKKKIQNVSDERVWVPLSVVRGDQQSCTARRARECETGRVKGRGRGIADQRPTNTGNAAVARDAD